MQNARITVNLRRIAFDRNCNMSKIARKTGISRTTLSALYHQKSVGVSLSTLEKLCNYLDCGIEDILVLAQSGETA